MPYHHPAEKVKELIDVLPEDQAQEVLDFLEFLIWRSRLEDQQDIEIAKAVMRRIDRGEEETIPWDEIKSEYGL